MALNPMTRLVPVVKLLNLRMLVIVVIYRSASSKIAKDRKDSGESMHTSTKKARGKRDTPREGYEWPKPLSKSSGKSSPGSPSK